MKEFDALLEVADILNSPEGCPWDREQTFLSLCPYVLEEAHELLEAVENKDNKHIMEELGDLFYTLIFYGKIAEREKLFTLGEVIENLKVKLIRRHPHVFGEEKAYSAEDVVGKWEKIKKEESQDKGRKSALDGIPKTLPSLQRGQKIVKRMKKHQVAKQKGSPKTKEEELADKILAIVREASEANIDIESAFRRRVEEEESFFRDWELKTL